MKANPANYCKRCRYYHGANNIVCALYPYGPTDDECVDFLAKSRPNHPLLHIPQGSEKVLIKGIIAFVLGYSFALWWVEIYLPGQTSGQPDPTLEAQTPGPMPELPENLQIQP